VLDAAFRTLDCTRPVRPRLASRRRVLCAFTADRGRMTIVLGDVSQKGLPTSVVVGSLLGAPAPSMLPVALGSQGLRVHLTELRAPKE
jgi:hypothetical protein